MNRTNKQTNKRPISTREEKAARWLCRYSNYQLTGAARDKKTVDCRWRAFLTDAIAMLADLDEI